MYFNIIIFSFEFYSLKKKIREQIKYSNNCISYCVFEAFVII